RLGLGRGFGRRGLVLALALFLALGKASDGCDALALLAGDQPDTPGVPANHTDLVDAEPDHLAAAGDQHDLVLVRHHAYADHPAGLVGGLHGDDALAAAAGEAVLVHLRALAVASLGDREQRRPRLDEVQSDHLVALVELHAPHPVRAAAHGPRLFL